MVVSRRVFRNWYTFHFCHQTGTGSEDEGMSSDGERGGEEYYDEYFEGIGADAALEDGEFGGGPWSGEDPYAYGGAD